MMEQILHICVIATIVCIALCVIKKYNKDYAILLSAVSGISILFLVFSKTMPVVEELKRLAEIAHVDQKYISILLKCTGICFVTQFASDCCDDAGEKSLSNKVELAGKISILVVAIPLFTNISDIVLKMINGDI